VIVGPTVGGGHGEGVGDGSPDEADGAADPEQATARATSTTNATGPRRTVGRGPLSRLGPPSIVRLSTDHPTRKG